MIRPLSAYFTNLDSVYSEQNYFLQLKARLLAVVNGLLLLLIPINLVKILWVQPHWIGFRLTFNLILGLGVLYSLRCLHGGRLEKSGSSLALLLTLPVHILLFLVPSYAEPLGTLLQLFVYDIVVLLVTLTFASRPVAWLVLSVITISQLAFYQITLKSEPIAGSLGYASDTLIRDGLIALGFVFCLGLTLVSIIDAVSRQSEKVLQATLAMNSELERRVSERTKDLEIATQRARDALLAKSEFLSNMSHEIRTPLNGIIAYSDFLLDSADLSPSVTDDIRLISDSGNLLLRLIGDILDFSKIEANQLKLETHAFALEPLMNDCVLLLSSSAAAGGVDMEVKCAPDLPRYIKGDSYRLRQIALNLIGNAVKFTPQGGSVQIRLQPVGTQDGKSLIQFEIQDTGIGMDEATLKRVFKRFSQADSSTTRRYGGTGLGLAISSRLVAMMGGELSADSTPGVGSVFTFTLALGLAEPAEVNSGSSLKTPLPQLGLHVLVVEDNSINQKIICRQLNSIGCTFKVAANGAEALTVALEEPLVDLILMDCHMPVLDGWKTTQEIRKWAHDPQASPLQRQVSALPIIALTAAVLEDERNRCREAGMTDFLSKPAKRENILKILQAQVKDNHA